MELNNYLIDTVRHVVAELPEEYGVQMVTYRVAASSAEAAMKRFLDEEAGEIIYQGEIVNSVIIGIQKEN